jgi:hypothetical protein
VLSPVDYFLWFLSAFLEAGVVVCAWRAGCFRRYLTLNLYMLAAFLVNVGRFAIYYRSGFQINSGPYIYFYFYSDALLTLLMYFAVMTLFHLVFEEMRASRYVHGAAVLLLSGTALFSYLVIRNHYQNPSHMAGRFVAELSQNLYFVGAVLTFVLWSAILKLRETRLQLIQLVLSFGIFFCAYAATYALWNLLHVQVFRLGPAVLGTLLPLSWAYTFTKVPEEARLAAARLVTTQR